MSSIPFHLIRGAHPNPENMMLSLLFSKINTQESTTFEPTEKKPTVISEHLESVVDAFDTFNGSVYTKKKGLFVKSRLPQEPDGQILRLSLDFNSFSHVFNDRSRWKNHARWFGPEPGIAPGWNEGVIGGVNEIKINKCIQSNSPQSEVTYALIPDHFSIQPSHTDFSAGYTILLVVRPLKYIQHNGIDSTLYQKIDDVSLNYAHSVRFGPSGEIKFFVRDNAIASNFVSEPGIMEFRGINMIIARYDPIANPKITLKVNNNDITNLDNETPTWSSTNIALDASIGIGNDLDKGAAITALQKLNIYRKPLSDTEAQNIWLNRRSISDIKFGEVAVGGHINLVPDAPTNGFDDVGFTTDGFT